MSPARRITLTEWATKDYHGYASRRADGVHAVLDMDPDTGATVLVPVVVVDAEGRPVCPECSTAVGEPVALEHCSSLTHVR